MADKCTRFLHLSLSSSCQLKKERGENPLSFLEPVEGHRGSNQFPGLCRIDLSVVEWWWWLLCTTGSDYELQELQVAHAQTISELEKTRKLLALQTTITKDCKREVRNVCVPMCVQCVNVYVHVTMKTDTDGKEDTVNI